jgi:hypothetical protein
MFENQITSTTHFTKAFLGPIQMPKTRANPWQKTHVLGSVGSGKPFKGGYV